MDKLPLRSMSYPLGSLAMDPSKGGLALQEASTQHSLQQLSYDPCFAERAAKYSTFGGGGSYAALRGSSSSSSQQQLAGYSSFDTGKLRDVLETESVARASIRRSASCTLSGSQLSEADDAKPKRAARSASPGVPVEEAIEGAKATALSDAAVATTTSQELSSGSQPVAPPPSSTHQQRKRKGNNAKDPSSSTSGEKLADSKTSEQTPLKRQRSGTSNDDALKTTKPERSASDNSANSSPRSLKGATSKPPKDELPKQDYIHVRARRGQATDSHSLAERVRREKISERMKFLQDLVPGCSKVTGKAVMLDEIINYVQSLQRQIEFLSMKLAAVNPRMEYSYDLLGKDHLMHSRSPETTLLGPDPLPGGGCFGDLHSHTSLHMPPSASPLDLHRDLRNSAAGCVDSAMCDAYLRRSMSVPSSLPSLASSDDHFDPLSQGGNLCNGDLQSVVEMGFFQGRQGMGLGTHLSHGSSLCMTGTLKVEM